MQTMSLTYTHYFCCTSATHLVRTRFELSLISRFYICSQLVHSPNIRREGICWIGLDRVTLREAMSPSAAFNFGGLHHHHRICSHRIRHSIYLYLSPRELFFAPIWVKPYSNCSNCTLTRRCTNFEELSDGRKIRARARVCFFGGSGMEVWPT